MPDPESILASEVGHRRLEKRAGAKRRSGGEGVEWGEDGGGGMEKVLDMEGRQVVQLGMLVAPKGVG